MTPVLHLVSWNIRLQEKAASNFLEGCGYDVALLQEVPLAKGSWERDHCDRGAGVVGLSNQARVSALHGVPLGRSSGVDDFSVSAPGTVAAARIIPETGSPFLAVSLYARWEKPRPDTPTNWSGYSDAMAHRAISDVSAFIGHKDPTRHRIPATSTSFTGLPSPIASPFLRGIGVCSRDLL